MSFSALSTAVYAEQFIIRSILLLSINFLRRYLFVISKLSLLVNSKRYGYLLRSFIRIILPFYYLLNLGLVPFFHPRLLKGMVPF